MLKVQYGATLIAGQLLSQAQTLPEPAVILRLKPNRYYTLIMSDPDAARPDWLHWLIINCTDISSGTILFPYSPPTPPSGTHHYYFYLCEQPHLLQNTAQSKTRGGFNTAGFINYYNLKVVAKTYCRVKADARSD
jgi:phosphatidylethanolamine-binding protein (PEBP) family uncharacterized protein